jgi:hypothetical protein
MVVKKDMKKATKKKVRTRVTVNIAEVNKVIDEIARKLVGLKYGYIVNDELEELRRLFR